MKNAFRGNYCYRTDIGKVRSSNEDEAKIVTNSSGNLLLIVADGMGGHNKGDFASFETVRIISEAFKDKKGFVNAYFASKWFIDTLYPMGCAAPAGSLLSVIVCGIAFIYLKRRRRL